MNGAITEFRGKHRFLSNFYPSPVSLDGVLYQSVEHAYQAAKTLDHEQRKRFQVPHLPASEAKRLGKTIPLRADWEKVKLDVMLSLLRHKFTSISRLSEQLLDTRDTTLVERNWWGDTFWGICEGRGKNHLGQLLMQVREEIRCTRE